MSKVPVSIRKHSRNFVCLAFESSHYCKYWIWKWIYKSKY